MSRSNMRIILSWTIFEPSQHSVAMTVYHVVMYDYVTLETKSSALVELLKRHICTIERITGMKFMSRSIMTIILSSTIFEPSQYSVAVTVYHVVMYDWVTRTLRFVMLRLKRGTVRWWSCLRDIFVQWNVSLV